MGHADDYFGDDYPDPSEKPWGMFLADGTTWERFMEVRNGDYTFVEDGLAELAPLIGMDSSNIVLHLKCGVGMDLHSKLVMTGG